MVQAWGEEGLPQSGSDGKGEKVLYVRSVGNEELKELSSMMDVKDKSE